MNTNIIHRKQLFFLLLFSTFIFSSKSQDASFKYVRIETNKGNMVVKLYNNTPKHRDYFLSQVRKGYFNGSLFGRVIPSFVIQGGSEDSKGAAPGVLVGHGRSSMRLKPEIHLSNIPRKGAIAMPRQPDDVNPEKLSDASQFFIVQGRIYTPKQLKSKEMKKNKVPYEKAMAKYYTPYKNVFDSLLLVDPRSYNLKVNELNQQIDSVIRCTQDFLLYSDEEKEAYTTVGGSPHLRGDYTIFGEVVDGFAVIDSIAKMPADRHNRPLQDVVMRIKEITNEEQK